MNQIGTLVQCSICWGVRGVARGGAGGANRPGRRVEGAPMKPTISTQLLFYRIILVGFPKTSLLIDVLAPPY